MKPEAMFSLKGKVAVVTGGARRIGKVMASYMADAGADVAIIDIEGSGAEETAKEIADNTGVKVQAFLCDVTKPDEIKDTIDKISKSFNGLDVLFNNAGICQRKSSLEVTPKEWSDVFDVNVNGMFYMAAEFTKKLIDLQRSGSIINMASISARIVNIPQEQASYNASKAAVIQMTKSLAVEWSEYNIRVNSISPGYIVSEMTTGVDRNMHDSWIGQTPLNRLGRPEELAGAVIYLASDCASFTTGCDIIIDGGFTCV